MNRSVHRLGGAVTALVVLTALALFGGPAALGQGLSVREQLLGSWTLVSVAVEDAGATRELYGPNPKGIVTFSPDGLYTLVVMRADLPKIASNNRETGTNEENKAIAGGVLAHFGRYSVNEADRTIHFQIEASSFPNWNGAKQIRNVTVLTGDDLKWTNPTSSRGSGTSYIVWRCAK